MVTMFLILLGVFSTIVLWLCMYVYVAQLRKETEEAAARGGASTSDQPDEKPLPIKKEEPDPDVCIHIT